jgi:hypothetical protein
LLFGNGIFEPGHVRVFGGHPSHEPRREVYAGKHRQVVYQNGDIYGLRDGREVFILRPPRQPFSRRARHTRRRQRLHLRRGELGGLLRATRADPYNERYTPADEVYEPVVGEVAAFVAA